MPNANTTPIDNSAIIERIRKILLKTSESGCSEAEAATAFAMASKLMAEYSIEMEEIRMAGNAAAGEVYTEINAGEVKTVDIQQKLGSGIIREFFFVQTIWINHHTHYALQIFGRPEHVETARYVFYSLMTSFHSLWENFRISKRVDKSERRIYLAGLASGFSQKMEDIRKAEQAEHDLEKGKQGGTALMLASIEARVLAKFEEANPDMRNMRTGSIKGRQSTFDRGFEDGKKISINKSVGGKGQEKLK